MRLTRERNGDCQVVKREAGKEDGGWVASQSANCLEGTGNPKSVGIIYSRSMGDSKQSGGKNPLNSAV